MSLIWGVPYLLIKVADGGVSVPVLVFARVAGAAVVLLPIAVHRGQLGSLRGHWRWLAVFACVEVILPWLFLSAAEPRPSSSLGGLALAPGPVLRGAPAPAPGGGPPAPPPP